MGSGRLEKLGKAGREAASVIDVVAALVDGFDPELTGARDAMDLVAVFSRIEHLARRGWRWPPAVWRGPICGSHGGHRSAAHWLARDGHGCG